MWVFFVFFLNVIPKKAENSFCFLDISFVFLFFLQYNDSDVVQFTYVVLTLPDGLFPPEKLSRSSLLHFELLAIHFLALWLHFLALCKFVVIQLFVEIVL